MEIKFSFINGDGTVAEVTYHDADSFDHLEQEKIKQTYAVALYQGKMVIVLHGKKQTWGLVGGSVERGETLEECLRREIKEESNMKVLEFRPVGYQEVKIGDREIYQLRYVCTVEPLGKFEGDPDGKITEMKLIDPSEYRKFFDWGDVGERVVSRALELSKSMPPLS